MLTRPSGNRRSAVSVQRLNASCFCVTLDLRRLCRAFEEASHDAGFCEHYLSTRPHLFSNVPVFLPQALIAGMKAVVAAIETVKDLPAYRKRVLSWAPPIAQASHGPAGAFMGYDFHLDEAGPRLIEINTNAGGAILNGLLAQAQYACCAEMKAGTSPARPQDLRHALLRMFETEWRLQRGAAPLTRIAIVDEQPDSQYLYPEFLLAQRMFLDAGIDAVVADPKQAHCEDGKLLVDGKVIDLVYNRLCDFAFERPVHAALKAAYESGAAVFTPNPHNHALLADKRNLTILSDAKLLAEMGVAADMRQALAAIPRTVVVTHDTANDLWQRRKHLFFKPFRGYGSKAVYRGDKLTRRVWDDIVAHGYVAQDLAPPSERSVRIDGMEEKRKMDVRLYTYGSETLLVAARLYQGQTTNFRTPGGGFAPVFAV